MAEKILVKAGESFLCEKDAECVDVMNDLRDTMFEQDMVLSILQSSSSLSQDVYHVVKDDYRTAYSKHQEAKNRCSKMVMSRYEAVTGTLTWNYDQLANEIYVTVNEYRTDFGRFA